MLGYQQYRFYANEGAGEGGYQVIEGTCTKGQIGSKSSREAVSNDEGETSRGNFYRQKLNAQGRPHVNPNFELWSSGFNFRYIEKYISPLAG